MSTPLFEDWRFLDVGRSIPISEGYADQPFVAIADDGAWVCVLTTGPGEEGAQGQHVVSARSTDQGLTWTDRAELEPGTLPESAYAAPVKAASGRIYAFYNYNADNLRRVPVPFPEHRDSFTREGYTYRVDCLGQFVFRYSDDHGKTWSAQRYRVPIRKMAIDRANATGGEVLFFWNASRILVRGDGVYIPLYKVGDFGPGFYVRSEGTLLHCSNLLTEPDPERLIWETLPEGDAGIRSPQPEGGPIAEEHSFSNLSDGSIYDVFRTTDGSPGCTFSRDGGRTWSPPQWKRYPDGRRVKNPRAANFAWRCVNGRFLYWFENHGHKSYQHRNPAWVLGGVENDGPDGKVIRWSQPEVLLYHDDPQVRMSYPDLIEDAGRTFITETKKDIARVHEIPSEFLASLWSQLETPTRCDHDLCLDIKPGKAHTLDWPKLPVFVSSDRHRIDGASVRHRTGFTLELRVRFTSLTTGDVLLDTRGHAGEGLRLAIDEQGCLSLLLCDGLNTTWWRCDRGMLCSHAEHHIGVVADSGPGVISFVIDGKFNDGGDERPFGWGRLSPHLAHANGLERVTINASTLHRVHELRVYSRALMTSHLVNHHRLGLVDM